MIDVLSEANDTEEFIELLQRRIKKKYSVAVYQDDGDTSLWYGDDYISL